MVCKISYSTKNNSGDIEKFTFTAKSENIKSLYSCSSLSRKTVNHSFFFHEHETL